MHSFNCLRFLTIFIFALFLSRPIVMAQASAQALLWEVTGEGFRQPSYIYGTIHAICPTDFKLTEQVKQKLKATERLSLEVDMDAPNFMVELQQAALLPEGGSLRSFFTKKDYALLAAHFQKTMSLNLGQLDNMKPFMLHSMLLSQLTECQAVSYEQTLMEMAQQQGKEVIGLETVGEQLSAIDKMPASMQAAMLTNMVTDMEKARKTYRKMVSLYLQQNLEGLDKLFRGEYEAEEYKLYEEAFLVNRNKRWIPVIEREGKIQPTFFAVGAGHLPGENGLLELLRKQGYTVTPVNQGTQE